jgi:branched-chain amino acid transport system substrate-binding protein
VQGYDAAQILDAGLTATRGDAAADRDIARAIRAARIDSPRGAFTLSASHNPVQNMYLREARGGENRVIGIAAENLADPGDGVPDDVPDPRRIAGGMGLAGVRSPAGSSGCGGDP